MMAVRWGRTEVVSQLIDAGANIDLQNEVKIMSSHGSSVKCQHCLLYIIGWRFSCDSGYHKLQSVSPEGQSWS